MKEINQIKYFNDKFGALKTKLGLKGDNKGVTNFDCYKKAVNRFESACGKVNDYSLKHFKYLAEMCTGVSGLGMEGVFNSINNICSTAF